MSLFGSLMGNFDDDPFFGSHRSMMRQMDQMMNSMMDPFEGSPFFVPSPFPALTQGRRQPRPARPRDPFSALAIPTMGGLMTSMDQMARQGECHTFSSSSVMTMTTGPDGRPTVYHASTSSRGVPGGVRETRRTVHDGHSGLRKMAIGHHIGERSHIIEREHKDGNLEERQEFVNLEEEEAADFDKEFRRHTQGGDSRSLDYRPRHRPSASSHRPRSSNLPALTSSSYRRRSRPMLSITAGPSDDQRRREKREEHRQRFKQV
ncbi:myeloid leukemia factor-like isoform X1 [Macrobrachium nipponense]|uniref:myeloid leukemia factor-like isoform X1 n=1 Tax=Macrobrachium nipponense TaxID=159736 RepID=UPI0030C8727E